MSTIPKIRSKETEMISLGSHKKISFKKLPVKDIFSNIQSPVITDPINPNRISKAFFTKKVSASSVVKAGIVFLGTVGSYYLAKTTGIFSYLKRGEKNPKDVSNRRMMEVKNKANALNIRKNLETMMQVNNPLVSQTVKTYKNEDKTIKFEEIKIEEFKDLPKVKRENVGEQKSFDRRSIIVQNPIPNQNVSVGKFFELKIDGTYVFSSSGALFLEATNIPTWLNSTNLNPTFKGSCDTPDVARRVALSGNYAYVVGDSLQIIDIIDPANPTFKGSYNMPDSAVEVALSGNYAYVADGDSGLQIIDVSDPANPIFKGSYDTPDSAFGVALSGNYAYVADGNSGLQIIDITDPANPIFKGSYDTPRLLAYEVALSGSYAYIADGSGGSGLQIIDVSDPANATFKGSYNTPGDSIGVTVSENYAYLACGLFSDLQIVDISDPANATFKGSYDTPDFAREVALFGNYAYVADGESGLQIIDVSDPANSTFKGSYDTPNSALGVSLSEDYAYVADRLSLQIIAPNLDKLILSGTPSSLGTYSVDIEACNEIKECATDSFNVIVGNNPPIVANPIRNQIVMIYTLFNYTFSNNTFIDPDGHSLTYTAKSSDNSPLPSWLNFNSLQRKFFGIPTISATYPIKVTANDSYGGSVSDIFDIIVRNTNTPFTDLTITLVIIGSITCVICTGCCAFSGGGIVVLRRHYKHDLALNEQKVPILPKDKKDVSLNTPPSSIEEKV
jgi:hypothetical protein